MVTLVTTSAVALTEGREGLQADWKVAALHFGPALFLAAAIVAYYQYFFWRFHR